MDISGKSRHGHRVIAVVTASALLALTGCGSDSGGGGDSDKGTITLGFLPSWTDSLSTSYLLDHFLTEAGYTVEHEELSEAGILYTGLAQGDVDMHPSAWPEVTHAEYMKEYGDRLEDLGSYYDNAELTFAVPEYSKITSIEELPDHVGELDGRVVGIEPGAGHTQVTQDSVFPAYGLGKAGFTLATSSTTAMLAELESAIDAKEEIVVTLWRPFWANETYSMRDLKDPKDALGKSESLHFLAHKGFAEEFPKVAEWVDQIHLDDETYAAMESSVVNDHPDDPAAGIDAFLKEYPDAVPEMPTDG